MEDASHYLRGWFTIDLVSCLPLGYIGYFMDDTGDGDSSNFRAIKAFRLIRLSKMLRLARIKRILTKYGNNVNLQSYINIGFTMFIIIFLAHMLACFYYMIGTSDETLITGEVAIGWVKQQDWCLQADAQTPCNDTSAMISDPEAQDLVVGTGSRYIGSMYYVLNPLENGGTTAERGFGIFAELMRDIILRPDRVSDDCHSDCDVDTGRRHRREAQGPEAVAGKQKHAEVVPSEDDGVFQRSLVPAARRPG